MKSTLKLSAFVLLTGILFYVSCKKEYSCENCNEKNKPPIANAGRDTIIVLPVDSVKVDGAASTDPDGKISSFQWTKISGPASFNIIHSSDSLTTVKNLTAGTYLFELKVTDNSGLSAKDTMQVIVDTAKISNHPPVANAGKDTTITLPVNTITLDGTGSTDPDNNIISYEWKKISGPLALNIVNANAIQTQVTNLVQGIYHFELKVTDAGGLFSKDTMQVIVNSVINSMCGFTQTLIGSLSIPGSGVLIQSAGNKIVFAGGQMANSVLSSRVDIYDTTNQTWSTAELSIAQGGMGVVSFNGKIYFAGGSNGSLSSRVDIYDASSNTWSIAELSEARYDVIAVAAGNKVLFAGGITSASAGGVSDKVDIYDQSTGSWSTATLSKPMAATFSQMGCTSLGNKIYFSGENIVTGSNSIDIYDASSNTWSTQIISPNQFAGEMAVSINNKIYFSGSPQGSATPSYIYAKTLEVYDVPSSSWSSVNMGSSRAYMAGISGDDKIFWAGGFDSVWNDNGEQAIRPLNNIEIYDVNTGLHSFHNLQEPDGTALKTNNKIFFPCLQYTEIYDMNNHSWTTCNIFLDQALAIGNTIYQLAADNSTVWKLEF